MKAKFKFVRLRRSAMMRKGDRRIYAGNVIGPPIYDHEIGQKVDGSGYLGVVRRKQI